MTFIFFDLDGTLLDNRADFPSVFTAVLREQGVETAAEQVQTALRESWSWYEEQVRSHQGDEKAIWLAFNTQVCRALGAGERAEGMGRAVTEAFGALDRPLLFDDVLPCLDELQRRGHALGVITARPKAPRVLKPLGILDRFCVVVDALSAGSAKQDAETFYFALERAGIAADQALHVGDLLERDVIPAQAAGMRAILLDRRGRYPDADCVRIAGLVELPALL